MSTNILTLCKMVGAGNDFLFVNMFDSKTRTQVTALTKTLSRSEIAKRLCRRHQGVGADGLIFIEKKKSYDFAWDFYNSDGSRAESCGNASRCAVLYASTILKIKKKQIRFLTAAGVVRGALSGKNRAKVFMAAPKVHHEGLEIKTGSSRHRGIFVNTGVPHFVTETKFRNSSDLRKEEARAIQRHRIFGREETNVTFLEILKKNRGRALTFERGVRDFTLACGTGAMAAAFALAEKTKEQKQIYIEMPGGVLSVSFDNDQETCLEGNAFILSQIDVLRESLYEH